MNEETQSRARREKMTDQTPAYPEFLNDLARQISTLLIARGMDQETAADVALEVAEFARIRWGGQQVYIPKGVLFELSVRDMQIWEKWNGRNALELCREFGLTKQRLYQIIAVVRERELSKRQQKLF